MNLGSSSQNELRRRKYAKNLQGWYLRAVDLIKELLLSCWTVETARSVILAGRGRHETSSRAAGRARILASGCAAAGIKIMPGYANEHAQWLAEVVGSEEETGALGLIFLERVARYIDAHAGELLSDPDRQHLRELGELEQDEVNEMLAVGGLRPPPRPEWPEAPVATAPGKRRLRFGILGDPHVGEDGSNRMVLKAIDQMAQGEVSFAVAIGDITSDGAPEHFGEAREIFDQSSIPIAVTLGNHDLWGNEDNGSIGLKHFHDAFGREPNCVQHADGVRVIVVNSADPARSPFPPFELMTGEFTDRPIHSVPGGTFSEETIDWMRGLGPDGTTFITLHHPPYPYLGMPPLVFGLDRESTEELKDLVQRTGAKAIFCGHTHRSAVTEFEGIPAVEVASSNDWPFGYGVIDVSDRGWSFNLFAIDAESPVDPTSHAAYLFRRYAQGPREARAFSVIDDD
jgi:predicted phosphodiesterase